MEKKIFLISHSSFAEGMKGALEMITGKQTNLFAYCLKENNTPNALIEDIRQKINQDDQIILLADITGGSMYNEAMSLLVLPNVRLIGGMNLSLLLSIVLEENLSDDNLEKIIQSAKEGIKLAGLSIQTDQDDFFN